MALADVGVEPALAQADGARGDLDELVVVDPGGHLAPEIETVYVMASPAVSFVSSSGVKEIASFGGNVGELVTNAVAERFHELYPNGRPGAPLSPQD